MILDFDCPDCHHALFEIKFKIGSTDARICCGNCAWGQLVKIEVQEED